MRHINMSACLAILSPVVALCALIGGIGSPVANAQTASDTNPCFSVNQNF
jgi:hypothetical protein